MCCAHLFIYMELPSGGCWVAEFFLCSGIIHSFVGCMVKDDFLLPVLSWLPELDASFTSKPPGTSLSQAHSSFWSTPEGFLPLSIATVSLGDFSTSSRSSHISPQPSPPQNCFCCMGFHGWIKDVWDRHGKAKMFLSLRICIVVALVWGSSPLLQKDSDL